MRYGLKFDKIHFIEGSQRNYFAPQYDVLKKGDPIEWLRCIIFVPTFGLIWYPLIALLSLRIVIVGKK
ncbi:MAG: hypothetical protein WCT49_02980 [Candidatus Paceibacterota bacterium]|jgi:hypothetical protein|nr:hypothetical protein [Candidatus Paceibacterota bacterium]